MNSSMFNEKNKYIVYIKDYHNSEMGIYHSEFEAWLSIDRDIREWMKTNSFDLDGMVLSTYYSIYKHDANTDKGLEFRVGNCNLCINFKSSVNFESYLDLINGVRKLKIKHILDN